MQPGEGPAQGQAKAEDEARSEFSQMKQLKARFQKYTIEAAADGQEKKTDE